MRFAHLLLIYSFYLSVTQRLPAVIVVKLQHLSHITEKHILRMSFQNLLSSCIPFKPHQLRNIVFMKDYRIACGISFCQTADFFTAFQKSVQKTIHCIRPQMGLVSHKKAVKMFLCLFRAARFPALSDPQLQGGGNAQSTLSILHRAKTVFCGCWEAPRQLKEEELRYFEQYLNRAK